MASTAFPTYTVRSIWEGALLSEVTGLDYEDASDEFAAKEKFYLNAVDHRDAAGVTLQMFRESDGGMEFELTFA